jgi:hypothetical protein
MSVGSSAARAERRVDAALAGAVASVVFGAYLVTIYPGLVTIGDAAKFAFVGRILGTPHAPGYPLWVMASHVFSYVPLGTLAYRMNVLSALFGALAAGVSYLLARRLGADRQVACAVAITLGFGQSFWAIALYAKGYTLNAALVATGTLLLLRWSDTRRVSHFLQAVAVFALSAGNHLTVVALVPALVLFAVATDARTVLRPSVLLAAGAIVLAGLCQYAFILVRTLQGAPFLEARARTFSELLAVMTARRFSNEIGAYSLSTLFSVRIPIVADLFRLELGAVGLPLVLVGLLVLGLRQPRRLILLGGGALGVLLLTANMSSEEDRGFLLASFVLTWGIAAVGLQWFVTVVRTWGGRQLSMILPAVLFILPVVQFSGNYVVNDHHADTFETEYFDALFATLPQKTAFVRDDYHYNMMLLYKLLGEKAAGSRDVRLVESSDRRGVQHLRDDGYEVLAFRSGRDRLSDQGFAFEPYVAPAGDSVMRRRELFRVAVIPTCQEIGNLGWRELTAVAKPKGRITVRIDNYRAYDAHLTLYAAADQRRDPFIVAPRGVGLPKSEVEFFSHDAQADRARLLRAAEKDGVQLSSAILDAPQVTRTVVTVNDHGDSVAFGMDLGSGLHDLMGSAVVDQDTPRRATVCSYQLAEVDAISPERPHLVISPDSRDVQFESGWQAIERRDDGLMWRWTTDRAALVVPMDRPTSTTITVNVEPFNGHPRVRPATVTLLVNGRRLQTRELPATRSAQSWTVDKAALRDGLNEVVLEVGGAARPSDAGGHDTRLLGVSMTSIELTAEVPAVPSS